MKLRNYPPQKKLRTPLIILAVILVLALTYGVIAYATKSLWPFQESAADKSSQQYTDEDSGINYSPPSDEDIEHSQDAKQKIEDERPNNSNPDGSEATTENTGSKKSVGVGVSFADVFENNVEIRAFIPQTIEGTGTCTATLTRGSQSITESAKGFVDSSSTQCEPILIPLSRFTDKGIWNLVVSYKSPSSNGKSGAIEVNI